MSVIRTTEDGWDCIPELKHAVAYYEDARSDVYEINNCVRQSDLHVLVENLRDAFKAAISILDEIDADVEIEQVEEL